MSISVDAQQLADRLLQLDSTPLPQSAHYGSGLDRMRLFYEMNRSAIMAVGVLAILGGVGYYGYKKYQERS
jgi:hypothetical protein